MVEDKTMPKVIMTISAVFSLNYFGAKNLAFSLKANVTIMAIFGGFQTFLGQKIGAYLESLCFDTLLHKMAVRTPFFADLLGLKHT
jgi:ABC-type branched-subunit amino acid transport system permease subunit